MTKLHLGCGPVKLEGWVNIDIESSSADLRLDLTEGLPFDDGSVTHIFSEHVIEHFDREEALALLRECRRVLSPQGVIRISTPDLAWLMATYFSAITTEWGELWQPNSPCSMANEGMRSWGHKFLYDTHELHAILREAGFSSLVDCQWHESSDPVLSGLESRDFHNDLIVEARAQGGELHDKRGAEPVATKPVMSDIEPLLVRQGEEIQDLRRQLADASIRLSAVKVLSAGEEAAARKITSLLERVGALEDELRKANDSLGEANQSIESKERELAAARALTEAIEQRLADTVESNGSIREALHATCETLVASEQRAAEMQKLLAERERELSAVTSDRNGLYGAVADREARLTAAAERLQDGLERIRALESIAESQSEVMRNQESALGRQSTALQERTAELSLSKAALQERDAELSKRIAEIDEQCAQLASYRRKVDEMAHSNSISLSRIEALEKSLADEYAKMEKLSIQHRAAETLADRLGDELATVKRSTIGRWVLRRAGINDGIAGAIQ